MLSKRTFTVVDYPKEGDTYGRYKSSTPGRAASKALTQLSRLTVLKNSDYIVFKIRDTKSKKEYSYVGTVVELHTPVIKNINGRNITYRYKPVITKYSDFINSNI